MGLSGPIHAKHPSKFSISSWKTCSISFISKNCPAREGVCWHNHMTSGRPQTLKTTIWWKNSLGGSAFSRGNATNVNISQPTQTNFSVWRSVMKTLMIWLSKDLYWDWSKRLSIGRIVIQAYTKDCKTTNWPVKNVLKRSKRSIVL